MNNIINLNQWKIHNKELKCPQCGGKVLETSQIADDELILIHFCDNCDYVNVSV